MLKETGKIEKTETKSETKSDVKPFATSDLMGQTKADAQENAKKAGYKVRVAEEDGVANMMTTDIMPKRINLTITKGVVSGIKMG